MSRVLLTGGIGSGKSSVGALLAERGARVIDADRVGHRVLEEEAREPVAERWPEAVRNGRVDRAVLADRVFGDPEDLRALEEITHPLIRCRIEDMLEGIPEEIVVVVEVPLARDFMGSGWLRVVVDAPEGVRRARLRERGMAEEEIELRMRAQPDRDAWREWADHVVDNSGSREDLRREVDRLWDRLIGDPDAPVH